MREIRTSGSTRGGALRSPPTLPVLWPQGVQPLPSDYGSREERRKALMSSAYLTTTGFASDFTHTGELQAICPSSCITRT
jgi:hypothetical protein